MKTISVKTEGGHYQILIGHGIIGQLGRKCKGLKLGRQVVIVADESVGKLYAESISKVLVSFLAGLLEFIVKLLFFISFKFELSSVSILFI